MHLMNKTLIARQLNGEPLSGPLSGEKPEIKIEFQIRSSNNRIVASFDDEEKAHQWVRRQFHTHGKNAARVHLFRVTTIIEQL